MSKYAFGVDVGGTTVKLGLFNDKGQVLDKWEIPTVKDNGGEKVLPDIAASIKNKMQEKNISVEELVGVGIGAPGAVDADGYMVNGAVNIGWGAFDLAETLKKELDLPVTVKAGNDANVAALGEMWQGGGKGYSNLVERKRLFHISFCSYLQSVNLTPQIVLGGKENNRNMTQINIPLYFLT